MASRAVTHDLTGLLHHADHGSQYLSVRYSGRLADLGIQASTGTVGDSHDSAAAEVLNALSKTNSPKLATVAHGREVEPGHVGAGLVAQQRPTALRAWLPNPGRGEANHLSQIEASPSVGALANR